jgi:hypothetical protein
MPGGVGDGFSHDSDDGLLLIRLEGRPGHIDLNSGSGSLSDLTGGSG